MDKQKQLRQEMIKIVESEEARQIFEEELRYLDEQALTEQGKIKSYKVDYDSFNKNPMGGFSVYLIINNNEELYFRVRLGRYDKERTLEVSSRQVSRPLKRFISEGE